MTIAGLDDPAVADLLLAMVPMPEPRAIDPQAIASLIVMLADPALRFVTGQLVFADGGADCVARGDDVWTTPP